MIARRLVPIVFVLGLLIPGAAATAGRDPLDPAEPWQDAYPLVVDVSATPNPSCDQPIDVTFTIYAPTAVGSTAEWRVSIGGSAYRTGRVQVANRLETINFTIPLADIPSVDTAMDFEARIVPRSFGRVWHDHLARSCAPLTVAALGDSIAWGQGLDHEMKTADILAQTLGQQTGRSYRSLNYAISGAVLDAPAFPPENDDSLCNSYSYAQDPDGDGQMEFGEVTQQTPDVYCQVERAKAEALAGNYSIDLVVLTGCINDLDPLLGLPYGITPGSEDLVAAVQRECSGIGAAATNPAADVPYFSGAKAGYGGRGMADLLLKIHQELPGHPKVILENFYWGLSELSQDKIATSCPLLPLASQAICESVSDGAAQPERWDQFARYSGDAYFQAAQQANAASTNGPFAVASDGRYTKRNSVLAPEPLVWGSPTGDPAEALRQRACPELSATVQQCLTAAMVHPNIAGARQYADTFALLPQVQDWFATKQPAAPSAAFTAAPTVGTPPFSVVFDATGTTPGSPDAPYHLYLPMVAASGTMARGTVATYHWYFGDGSDEVTTSPTVTHTFVDPGPFHAELVVTDAAGRQSLAQASAPIVAADVPRIPSAFSAVKGSADLDGATVSFDIAQRTPGSRNMTGPITITLPQTEGSITAVQDSPVERGADPKTQIHSSASGIANGRRFSLEWSYTAIAEGGHLVLDITGDISAHIEGDVGEGSIRPVVRNYYEIVADLTR